MKALIESIVVALVDHPEDIVVEEKEEETKIVYHLTVNQSDVGKVIGKNGRIAKAIRTVVYAAKTDANKRIYLDICKGRGSTFPFFSIGMVIFGLGRWRTRANY